MATHSSVLAWRIPGMAEPGGLPSMGSAESDTTEATYQQQIAFCFSNKAAKKFYTAFDNLIVSRYIGVILKILYIT